MSLYPQFDWSNRRDLNSQHSAWKADALPIELLLHIISKVDLYLGYIILKLSLINLGAHVKSVGGVKKTYKINKF